MLFLMRVVLTMVALAGLGVGLAPCKETGVPPAAEPKPVIVELFTSEGCSSCPSADILLGQLQRSQPVDGARIIALAQHVDYWNSLGWADPFSSPEFTRRQTAYTRKFQGHSPYTPQMVVDGRAEFVGSDRRRALESIADAARRPKARVVVRSSPDGATAVQLEVGITELPSIDGGAVVMLALTEGGLTSKVTAGENVGRSLSHGSVVRSLEVIGELRDSEPLQLEPVIDLAKEWDKDNLRAVVFVQERKSRHIVGAGTTPLHRSPGGVTSD